MKLSSLLQGIVIQVKDHIKKDTNVWWSIAIRYLGTIDNVFMDQAKAS